MILIKRLKIVLFKLLISLMKLQNNMNDVIKKPLIMSFFLNTFIMQVQELEKECYTTKHMIIQAKDVKLNNFLH